jgi:hypothetical protein
MGIVRNVESLEREVGLEKFRVKGLRGSVCQELLGVSLPGLKLIQTLSVQREEKRGRGLSKMKEHIKEQHKDAVILFESSSTSSTFNCEALMSSIYDSIDQNQCPNAPPPASDILFEKGIFHLT